jgi:D-inositol-3-phosphate glycosyltransferase
MKKNIAHLVDDASWGGVNRLLDCLSKAPFGLVHDEHQIIRVKRGIKSAPQLSADIIVSHMAVCWKNVPFFAELRSTYPQTPLVHIEHSYSESYVALNVNRKDRFSDLLNFSYSLFDTIVAVSSPQSEWLLRRGYCQPDQLVTIPSCVNLTPFERIANQIPEGPVTIGAIGRFHEQKGFDILVEAFANHLPNEIQLHLVGDGPDKELLVQKANGRSNIKFVDKTDTPALAMSDCDIIAMPSRWEPYGLVAIEAMTALRTLMCSNVDGLKEHISNGAIAVAENTPKGWARALEKLTDRRDIHNLPRGFGTANAEWKFLHSWNTLIKTLLREELSKVQAA